MIRTFADGEVLTQQGIHSHLRGEGKAWRTDFTPEVWQGGVTAPTYDESVSRYAQFGRTVLYMADIQTTHSSAVGSATVPMAIRLPVRAATPQLAFGSVSFYSGSGWYHGIPVIEDPEWAMFLHGNSTNADGIGGDSSTYNGNIPVGARWWVAVAYEAVTG